MRACLLLFASTLAAQTIVVSPAGPVKTLAAARDAARAQRRDLGLVYAPAVGVWALQSGRNQIVHNHIHDLFYTAISVGWTWGYAANQSKGNIIEYTHLHDIGKEMLSDMGGIYTLGEQPGTRIRNNLIHDIASFTYGGWGIYPDEGSSEMLIENNIVYHCKSAGFHQHYGRKNVVRNNVWAFNRENQLMRTRVEPHISFIFERNIVYFDQGRLLGSNWTGDKCTMKGNLYFDTRGTGIRGGAELLAVAQYNGINGLFWLARQDTSRTSRTRQERVRSYFRWL